MWHPFTSTPSTMFFFWWTCMRFNPIEMDSHSQQRITLDITREEPVKKKSLKGAWTMHGLQVAAHLELKARMESLFSLARWPWVELNAGFLCRQLSCLAWILKGTSSMHRSWPGLFSWLVLQHSLSCKRRYPRDELQLRLYLRDRRGIIPKRLRMGSVELHLIFDLLPKKKDSVVENYCYLFSNINSSKSKWRTESGEILFTPNLLVHFRKSLHRISKLWKKKVW